MATSTKCFQARQHELNPQWYVIDAADQVVGRLAAQIAPFLMGKHRPTYTPHVDTGDYVIVINADKVVFTGNKWETKSYQRFTGYPGGQKEEVAGHLLKRRPERILELAIRRMMPKSKIGRHMMAKLKLYAGPRHPHQAQAPIPLEPVNGRPAAAGILHRPKSVSRAPRPMAVPEPAEAPAAAAEASLPAPPPEPSLPAPEAPPAELAPPPETTPPAEGSP